MNKHVIYEAHEPTGPSELMRRLTSTITAIVRQNPQLDVETIEDTPFWETAGILLSEQRVMRVDAPATNSVSHRWVFLAREHPDGLEHTLQVLAGHPALLNHYLFAKYIAVFKFEESKILFRSFHGCRSPFFLGRSDIRPVDLKTVVGSQFIEGDKSRAFRGVVNELAKQLTE
ncbi:predicted protein [Histoplasma capsulatum G186AR]|uniref:Uncharacterized protein n=1 Tax=Ajellomyces capsulatus (strain G186AR / H82 / ATCC MYA-2454 / RMSCC 2432) TaxID=447093 RepID=C0P0I4_AJECG|nr:uncharacterized protein HCBG_08914 [Histoplasma capsulatum G186AR]EEH02804.1 predicted protein [Histoplasma capsulatum G186AR]